MSNEDQAGRAAHVRTPQILVWAAAALIATATATVYTNSFTDLFAGLDAKESIRDNPHIRRLWPLSEAMSLPLLDFTQSAVPQAGVL